MRREKMAEQGSSENLVEMIKKKILQQILAEISGRGSQSPEELLLTRMRAGYIKSDNDNYGSYTKD